MLQKFLKIIFFSSLTFVIVISFQCKKTKLGDDSQNDASLSTENAGPTPTYEESGGKIICTTDNVYGTMHEIALRKFAELVKRYSNGKLEAIVHYIGNEKYPAIRGEEINTQMLISGRGGVHVTTVFAGNFFRKVQILEFLNLPYIFPNFESAKRLFRSDYMNKELHKVVSEKHNIRILGWLIGGYRNLTNSKRPITKIEHIKGMKIRTPQNRIMRDTYVSFGADVKALKWATVFDALKDGKVDGQENPFSTIVNSKFWDANQKYVTTNSPFLWVGPIAMDEKFYQSLPDNLKKAVERAGNEASYYEWNWTEQKNIHFKNVIRKNGMKILALTDKNKWVNASRHIWKNAYSNIGYGDSEEGKKVLNKVKSITLR